MQLTPAAARNSQVDTTAGLQVVNGLGLQSYTSSTVGDTPAVVKFDNLTVFPVAGWALTPP